MGWRPALAVKTMFLAVLSWLMNSMKLSAVAIDASAVAAKRMVLVNCILKVVAVPKGRRIVMLKEVFRQVGR